MSVHDVIASETDDLSLIHILFISFIVYVILLVFFECYHFKELPFGISSFSIYYFYLVKLEDVAKAVGRV